MALFRAERKAKNSVLQKQWEVPPKCSSLSCEKYKLRLLRMNHWSMPMWTTLIYIHASSHIYILYLHISSIYHSWQSVEWDVLKLLKNWEAPDGSLYSKIRAQHCLAHAEAKQRAQNKPGIQMYTEFAQSVVESCWIAFCSQSRKGNRRKHWKHFTTEVRRSLHFVHCWLAGSIDLRWRLGGFSAFAQAWHSRCLVDATAERPVHFFTFPVLWICIKREILRSNLPSTLHRLSLIALILHCFTPL